MTEPVCARCGSSLVNRDVYTSGAEFLCLRCYEANVPPWQRSPTDRVPAQPDEASAKDAEGSGPNQPGEPLDLTPGEIQAFVGPKADYYLDRWDRLGRGAPRLGFNWAAFFFMFIWLLYRRMFRWFWIGMAAVAVETLVVELAVLAALLAGLRPLAIAIRIVDWFVPILVGVLFGTYGSYWYYLYARREIRRASPAGRLDLEAIARAGGTNEWAPVVAATIFTALAAWATTMES